LNLAVSRTAGEYTLYSGSDNISNVQNVVVVVSLGSLLSRALKTEAFERGHFERFLIARYDLLG
jgi:hypothetical protein